MDANLELLDALENETNASIMKLNNSKIKDIKNNILQKLQLEKEQLKKIHKKLKEYRYCSDMSDLQDGFFIRWIPLKNPEKIKLTNGAHICDILYENNMLQILCRGINGFVFQIRFDECIVFQKLSDQEKVILSVLDYLDK
jgi:hypothetical protein